MTTGFDFPIGPQRIICMTEETTEWLYLLGQEHRIVGISGYTVRPARARQDKPRISAFTSAKIDKKNTGLATRLRTGFFGLAGRYRIDPDPPRSASDDL